MGLKLITSPAVEPITLAEAKAHCRVETANDNTLITSLIVGAREFCEDFTRRAFITQTWDLTIDYDWPVECIGGRERERIIVPKPPLQSIGSITYVDLSGNTQTLDASKYKVSANGVEGLIEEAYEKTWPGVREQLETITVQFTAGYGVAGAVPQRIKQAMLLLIGAWYEHREQVVLGATPSEVPKGVEALLMPLRVFY